MLSERENTLSGGMPTFLITSEGKDMSAYPVFQISVTKSVNRIDTAEIVLLDGSVTTEDFEISNSKSFAIGNSIEIKAGYEGGFLTIFKGAILKHAVKMDDDSSYLIITAKHVAYKMAILRKNAVYKEKSDHDILDEIFRDYGIKLTMEDTPVVHESVVQYNAMDWDFINMRADANAMLVITGDDEIVIKKPDLSGDAKLEINSGTAIFNFEAEMDGRLAFGNYEASSWNFTNQKLDVVSANTHKFDTPQGDIRASSIASRLGNEKFSLNIHSAITEESCTQEMLHAVAMRNNLSRITGKVSFPGKANIQPGDIIHFSGVGNHFNGKSIASIIKHAITSDNWQTTLHFGVDYTLFGKQFDDINTPPASSVFPAINGLQAAKVIQLEGDPLGEDRILIHLPNFTSGEVDFWARVATLDAGKERGSFFMPEIGDEVIVGFIDDNPNNAIVLGMLHSSSLPSPVKIEDTNNIKGFYSREKIKLEFNDEDKAVLVETPAGNIVKLNDKDKAIVLEDEHGNKISLDKNGITIKSSKTLALKASNNIEIEGKNITIKASMGLKAEGNTSAEVSSSGNTVLKGSIVQIN